MARKKLGEVLRQRGKISAEDLYQAISEQQGRLVRLGELLLERRLVSKQDLISALEEVTRVPYLDWEEIAPSPEALRLIPWATARQHCLLPFSVEKNKLVVIMAEPQNLAAVDELRFLSGMDIVPRLGFRPEITAAIDKYYAILSGKERPAGAKTLPDLPEAPPMEFITTSSRQSQREAMIEFQAEMRQQRTPAVRLVSSMIALAVEKQASDIHIEPQAKETILRIRVDGVLRDLRRLPRALQNSVISRLKILADMDIAERRTPQDGSFLVQMGTRRLDLRISTLPTHYGEKVVVRILEAKDAQVSFHQLGLPPEIEDRFKRVLSLPQGLVLVSGPTGSGKSTTLYAALRHIQHPGINIVTVEDPVEYLLEGVSQVQVNTKAGLTFAGCLRSIVRQDPNVIMVGEIRDRETAEIALKAAQTGHLVLSTLHTNDSVSAITRLLDLNIPAFLIASSLTAVLAQRLVRRLCVCRKQVPVEPDYAARLEAIGLAEPSAHMFVPVGCDACDGAGFKGRVGVFEMLETDDAIRNLMRSGARVEEIRAVARGNGFRTMQEDALDKIQAGVTTLDEVLRVVTLDPSPRLLCPGCAREQFPAFLYCPFCGTAQREPGPARPELLFA